MSKNSGRRKLTPFICQELLYDYAIDALDPERKAAVEEFLQTHPDSRRILETIQKGFAYAHRLSQFEVSPALIERLDQSENVATIGRKFSSFKEWPDSLRWSSVALVASAIAAVLIAVIPWASLMPKKSGDDKTVVLAPLPNQTENAETGESGEVADTETESSGDFDETGAPVEDKPVPPAAPIPTTTPLVVAKTQTPVIPASQPEPATNSEASEPTTVASKQARPQGFVYRAFMTLPNIENVSDQIVQQITELGGTKAGEVELGWKRGTLRYFHFSLPAASEDALMEQLRAYGPVRISKDPHPRVMPEGQVRFILSIDSK